MSWPLAHREEFVATRSQRYPFHVVTAFEGAPRPTEVTVRPFCRTPFKEKGTVIWQFETPDDATLFKIFLVKRIAEQS